MRLTIIALSWIGFIINVTLTNQIPLWATVITCIFAAILVAVGYLFLSDSETKHEEWVKLNSKYEQHTLEKCIVCGQKQYTYKKDNGKCHACVRIQQNLPPDQAYQNGYDAARALRTPVPIPQGCVSSKSQSAWNLGVSDALGDLAKSSPL